MRKRSLTFQGFNDNKIVRDARNEVKQMINEADQEYFERCSMYVSYVAANQEIDSIKVSGSKLTINGKEWDVLDNQIGDPDIF